MRNARAREITMRHRRAPTSARGGAGGKLTKFRLLVPARYNASRLVGSIGYRRGCERRINFRLSLSLALSSSLFAAEGSYYGVISTPLATFPPAHCGIKFPYCHAMRPRQVRSRTRSGGGYCNFYRWTGVCVCSSNAEKKRTLWNDASNSTEPRGYVHVDVGYILCIYLYMYTCICLYAIGVYGCCPAGSCSNIRCLHIFLLLAANTRHAE